MKLVRVGRHRGYYEVVRTTPRPCLPKQPKPLSRRARVNMYADRLWRRYGDMFGDWAVAGMNDEERDRFIGGGDRRLDRLARESMEDGLSDVMSRTVPLELADSIRRAVFRLAGFTK